MGGASKALLSTTQSEMKIDEVRMLFGVFLSALMPHESGIQLIYIPSLAHWPPESLSTQSSGNSLSAERSLCICKIL